MKLSDAIEHCIRNKFYSYPFNEYMCHALRDAGLHTHIPAVMDKVRELSGRNDCTTMCNALMDAGLPELAGDWPRSSSIFKLTLQFYIWWIVQLRKEGK